MWYTFKSTFLKVIKYSICRCSSKSKVFLKDVKIFRDNGYYFITFNFC